MPKKIPLTKGKFALVDNHWFDYLNQWKWCINCQGYAVRNESINGKKTGRMIRMHRVIANTPEDKFTDHINGNKIDNRSRNLRVCDKSQNSQNRKPASNNTSGYRGISWNKRYLKWETYIEIYDKRIRLGLFRNLKDAILTRNRAAMKYFGEFAILNKIERN